jgi:poly(hydroxyalkanoate) depolymerase family esterase
LPQFGVDACSSKGKSMSRTLTASMRRMSKLMRPAKMATATRSFQKAMSGFMMETALAPLAAKKPKTGRSRKEASSRTASPKGDRKLGAVIRQLRAAQSLLSGATVETRSRGISLRIPKGAQYLARTHRNAAGSRSYKIYIPASQPIRPRGLIVMLHGCSQTPDDFAAGTRINALAEKHGLAVAYPAQTRGHNRASCWNWFKPGNQIRGAGEPAILASMTRKLMREFGLGRDAVFVAGLSAGGAMAAILADVYPDVYSAAGIHSGLTRGAASNVISAMSAMRKGGKPDSNTPNLVTTLAPTLATGSFPVRRIVFQGDADSTVHPSNAAMIVAAAMGGDAVPSKIGKRTVRGRGYARSQYSGSDGAVQFELWMIKGSAHAWSGGHAAGSYTDSKGPDASVQMIRFFLEASLKNE